MNTTTHTRLRLSGRLDVHRLGDVRRQLRDATGDVALDLTDTVFIDTAVLSAIDGDAATRRRQGHASTIVDGRGTASVILDLARRAGVITGSFATVGVAA